MKRKCLLILTILVLAIIISGCAGGIVTPDTDEAKVRSVIQEYYLALNDQNWSKAKSYCINGSIPYNEVIQWENIVNTHSYCGDVVIKISPTIIDVYINGNVDICIPCYIKDLSTACGKYIGIDVDQPFLYLHLQKVGNIWKLSWKHY